MRMSNSANRTLILTCIVNSFRGIVLIRLFLSLFLRHFPSSLRKEDNSYAFIMPSSSSLFRLLSLNTYSRAQKVVVLILVAQGNRFQTRFLRFSFLENRLIYGLICLFLNNSIENVLYGFMLMF